MMLFFFLKVKNKSLLDFFKVAVKFILVLFYYYTHFMSQM